MAHREMHQILRPTGFRMAHDGQRHVIRAVRVEHNADLRPLNSQRGKIDLALHHGDDSEAGLDFLDAHERRLARRFRSVQHHWPDGHLQTLPVEREVSDLDAPSGRFLDLRDHPAMHQFIEPAAAEHQDGGERAHRREHHQSG